MIKRLQIYHIISTMQLYYSF